MKNFQYYLMLLAATAVAMAIAAPPFVTPSMIQRNGLTDEQYELLWSQGKNPQIDIGAARDWIYRAARYTNVVEWLEICGRTNDFAKLCQKLQGDNFVLSETNATMKSEIKRLGKEILSLSGEVYWATNRMATLEAIVSNRLEVLQNDYRVATNALAYAEARAERLDKIRDYLVEQRDKALLQTTKAIYQAIIDKLDAGK